MPDTNTTNGEVLDQSIETMPVRYSVTDTGIANLRAECSNLKADSPGGYEEVRLAIAKVRGLRTGVEKRRQELKAESLEWGRKVDSEARRLTGLLYQIEEPLKVEKATVDDAKERERRAEEERIAAEERKAREAVQARVRAIQEAEAAKLQAERAELEKQRAAMLKEQEAERTRRQAEQNRLDAERRQVETERRAVEVEKQRIAREKAEVLAAEAEKREADELAERRRVETEQRRQAAEQAAEEARLRREAAKPDIEKVQAFGRMIRGIAPQEVKGQEARDFLGSVQTELSLLADRCELFMS